MAFGMRGPTGDNLGSTMAGRSSLGPYSGQKLAGGFKQGQLTNFTPEQMQLFQSLFSQVGPESYTAKLARGDQGLFEEMEAPAHRQFEGALGSIANRFSNPGQGALSARRSGGFNRYTSQAASDFAQDLQSRRQALQRQAIADLLGMSRDLLHEQPYGNYAYGGPQPQKKSFLEQILGPLGAGVGTFFGGPAGGAALGGLGSALGGLFSK